MQLIKQEAAQPKILRHAILKLEALLVVTVVVATMAAERVVEKPTLLGPLLV